MCSTSSISFSRYLLYLYAKPILRDVLRVDMQGLVYMHDMGVAHRYASIRSLIFCCSPSRRDCADRNIQLDPSDLFPGGFHPVLRYMEPDLKRAVRPLSRLFASKSVQYYFIDFGISMHGPDGKPRAVLGVDCLDKSVPELSSTVPYDPFKEDIYILGNLFKQSIHAVCVDDPSV